MNIRNAQLVLNPDARFQPKDHCCGYVPVYAVAPGCLPVEVGALYTTIWRGELRFNVGEKSPVRLAEALDHVRAGIQGDYDLRPMSEEMLAVIGERAQAL